MTHTTIEHVTGKRIELEIPDWASENDPMLTENARKVLISRYIRRDASGEPLETIAGMFYRIAHIVADDEGESTERKFYELMTSKDFFPNSPTFTGAGTPLGQLSACFVLPIADDMGKGPDGIFQTLRNAALIQQTGGGNGFSFSRLREKGSSIAGGSGKATGPVDFMRVFDAAFGSVAQGGVRRGANMAILRCDHPDIEEFITCKAKEGDLSNFNISVAITNELMLACQHDESFNLRSPHSQRITKTLPARELFAKIVHHAHKNGEPGVVFIDTANNSNPLLQVYKYEATNPCSEQYLPPYGNCTLGSINLANHVTEQGVIDWLKLKKTISTATHFLDNVVTVNKYIPSVPQVKERALAERRIGLGIMGLADALFMMGIRYGSSEAREVSYQIMEFVRFYAMERSNQIAMTKPKFGDYARSVFARDWKYSSPSNNSGKWGRPSLDWAELEANIAKYGLRNAATTTIAPTGTIATVCGIEGYGCEPVFALGYTRNFNRDGKNVELPYTSRLFTQALLKYRGELTEEQIDNICKDVAQKGNCQTTPNIPDELKRVFVTAEDISPQEHVGMQAALQLAVDNGISKTCNMPAGTTEEQVAEIYQLAWKNGCKGITVYIAGSREKVVLETKATKDAKDTKATSTPKAAKRQRPPKLHGETHRVETPLGNAYVTVNKDEHEEPFEVFVNVGKAGSDVSSVAEALGRVISLLLRADGETSPTMRLEQVQEELKGIGGSSSVGFGPNRVSSLPDGIARVLGTQEPKLGERIAIAINNVSTRPPQADLCPSCGQAALINSEGCKKCFACGYSKC